MAMFHGVLRRLAGDSRHCFATGGPMRAGRLAVAAMAAICFLGGIAVTPLCAATILVYHSFGVNSSMSISLAAFTAQLDYLQQTGHTIVPLDELTQALAAKKPLPDKAVAIAIDDGWATVMKAYAILRQRDLPFTVFLPMAYVANPGCTSTLSQADIDTLKTYPKVTFANHSWSHSPKLAGSESLAREDIRKSCERFKQVVGRDTRYFAYPYGRVSETYERLLREAGFEDLFVTGYSPVGPETRATAIPRIAAHKLSIPVLASVLRDHEALLAKNKAAPAPTPEKDGPLLTATGAAAALPGNVE